MGASLSPRGERVHELEAALSKEKDRCVMLEASIRREQEHSAELFFKCQCALAAGLGIVATAGLAVPLMMQKRVAFARAATERALCTQHEATLADVRRRAAHDLQSAQKFAVSTFARDLLTVADNMEFASNHARQQDVIDTLAEGVLLTEQSLLHTLSKHGVERQAPLGQQFDPHLHEAMLQEPSATVEAGKVTQVMRSGFTIHDRVLRAAQVAVASGIQPSSPGSDGERTTHSADSARAAE